MYTKLKDHITTELRSIREAGLYKTERCISSAQGTRIVV